MDCPTTIIRTINAARSTKIQQMATATMVIIQLLPAYDCEYHDLTRQSQEQLSIGERSESLTSPLEKQVHQHHLHLTPTPTLLQGDEILISPTPITNCSEVTIQCCPRSVQGCTNISFECIWAITCLGRVARCDTIPEKQQKRQSRSEIALFSHLSASEIVISHPAFFTGIMKQVKASYCIIQPY